MMGLNFLLLFSVGMFKPIKNALALDGLGQSQFYKVYLVSTFVILLAPLFNRLSDKLAWRTLIPATAAFFTANLLLFRLLYTEGSGAFGMVFYGWTDLFAAALVTQFFMAVQVFFNARDAKSAIPLVIAAGSVGATLGNLTSGTLAETLGTPNLMLLAALFVGAFTAVLPFVWTGYPPVRSPARTARASRATPARRDFVRVFSNRHVRLIATLVLVTIVVKSLVDYEYNETVAAFFLDRDRIASFQGYVNAVLGPLPILVLLPLGPFLKRWGVGAAVLMLPLAVASSTGVLAVAFGLWTATAVKGVEQTFRYSAERTAREILYVPVPLELKLRAKAYIDMAIEKGAKGVAGLLIFVLLLFVNDYTQIVWAAFTLAVAWCFLALAAKKQYLVALAESIRGRFANLEGGFASLTERSTLAMVEDALRGDIAEVGFALDLVEQAGSIDAQHLADEMDLLLGHPEEEVRARVLRLLARFTDLVPEERIRECLSDESDTVREAAVRALAAKGPDESSLEQLLGELAASDSKNVRTAVLSWLVGGGGTLGVRRRVGASRIAALTSDRSRAGDDPPLGLDTRDASLRLELALASGLLDSNPEIEELLRRLLDDEDATVQRAAIRSAAAVDSPALRGLLVTKLGEPSLRGPVREALAGAGAEVAELCGERLQDAGETVRVRRNIPAVLARTQHQRSVDALLRAVGNRETPREVRFQALKALNKLRSRDDGTLRFEAAVAIAAVEAEADEARRYLELRAVLDGDSSVVLSGGDAGLALLAAALEESWADRREAAFRLLGLVYAPDAMYRAHSALTHSDDRTRANAVELLEGTLGRDLFRRLSPVLAEGAGGNAGVPRGVEGALDDLSRDSDPWLSSLAAWHRDEGRGRVSSAIEDGMDLIQKVFLLQKVDLLQGAKSSDLGLLASIAEEVDAEPGELLLRQGEPSDALYVVVRGAVELSGVREQTLTLGANTPFGTWSLVDSDPSVVGVKVTEHSILLRITRSDFQELLEDHPDLVAGILQALARRIRSILA